MTTQPTQKRGLLYHLIDITLNIVIIVAIVAAIRTFVVSPFQVEGSSMTDTLKDKEYIVINKFRYIVGSPDRGDIVVFRPLVDEDKYYVKRIIGLPGDTIVVRDGDVFVRKDGKDTPLNESYLSAKNADHTFRAPVNSGDTGEVVYNVPIGQYFVLGDNRMGSLDSRSFMKDGEPLPFVPESNIKGSVWFVALPITKIHAIEPPAYQINE